MALGSQPASMPAESNLDQMTHLISPARSELSEIDPSWEIQALADADGSIGTSSADDFGAALCANPRTPVCGSPSELATVPTVEQCADAVAAAKRLSLSLSLSLSLAAMAAVTAEVAAVADGCGTTHRSAAARKAR